MREASSGSASHPRGWGGPPSVSSNDPSSATSNPVSLSNPAVLDGNAPSSALASTVKET